ncbi:hypothetical protein GGS21DRAFT_532188 [Xylaria nigripes]|nr:hypothetical protein GGS21DRAFT_532188 [Xylaria nigripes]
MSMSIMHPPRVLTRPRSICQICESTFSRRRIVTPPITTRPAFQHSYLRCQTIRPSFISQCRPLSTDSHGSKQKPVENTPNLNSLSLPDITKYLNSSFTKVSSSTIPNEESVRSALEDCNKLAERLIDESSQHEIAYAVRELDCTASTLLSLDGAGATATATATAAPTQPPQLAKMPYPTQLRQLIDQISQTAYQIIAHRPVIITPKILKQYVKVQAKLGRPETLPRVFDLYACKPVPRKGSEPPTYTTPNPKSAGKAIESEVVDTALDTSIEAKNIDAAVGIIENSYARTAFVRSKLLRNGLLPLFSVVFTPVAAYILASKFAGFQQAMDSGTATGVAFAGILAYVGFTASIGLVAVTTANDQMKRVSWAPGIPLRERWIREEERAALDKIACAWGFKEPWRQGEEDGTDWNALREYIGQKGMILDRTELMEGMQ